MNPITLKIENVQVTARTIQRNKSYRCTCDDRSISCKLKRQLSVNASADTMIATEVVFNVRNTTNESWSILLSDWELIDTDGYAYKARALCDSLRPPRTIEPALFSRNARTDSPVTPGTQVDFVLVFPELEDDKEIAYILYSGGKTLQAFQVKELKPEAIDLMQACNAVRAREAAKADAPSREPELRRFRFNFNRLERRIHSRLNKALTKAKASELENDIMQDVFGIKQDLEYEDEHTRKAVEAKLASITTPYESELAKVKAQEEERKKLDQTIDHLSNLTGLEFEEWLADLLKVLGYEKVNLTPPSNDEGIDILVENKGSIIAVQCKRWKDKVGRPEVQAFLGAIHHAQVQRGMLVTTKLFTEGARKMASEHPIELVDGDELRNLIQKARQK